MNQGGVVDIDAQQQRYRFRDRGKASMEPLRLAHGNPERPGGTLARWRQVEIG
jgi:hypothetical protein